MTYTLTVANGGPGAASSVTLADTLPPSASFSSAAPSGTCSRTGGTVSCSVGALASGASSTVTIVVTPTAAGTMINTASVASPTPDGNLANNSVSRSTTVNPPNCSPRPSVTVSAVPNGAGGLQVTIAAGTSAGAPGNRLQSIQIGAATNALVDIGGKRG